MKNKKWLYISLIALDVAIVIFLFIISILVIVKGQNKEAAIEAGGLIGFLLSKPTVYFAGFVLPLFLLLAGNIVILLLFVKKQNQKQAQKVELNDLSEEQKEELRKALMEDMNSKE